MDAARKGGGASAPSEIVNALRGNASVTPLGKIQAAVEADTLARVGPGSATAPRALHDMDAKQIQQLLRERAAQTAVRSDAYVHSTDGAAVFSTGPVVQPEALPEPGPAAPRTTLAPATAVKDRSAVASAQRSSNAAAAATLSNGANPEPPIEEGEIIDLAAPLKPMPAGSTNKTSRKDVVQLRNAMIAALRAIKCEDAEHAYSSNVHGFVSLIEQENAVFTQVFDEVIRQVATHMIERGELLNEIRHRYSSMFGKIPRHVRALYTEVVTLRDMNRRLADEMERSQAVMVNALADLDNLKHDAGGATAVASPPPSDESADVEKSEAPAEQPETPAEQEHRRLYLLQRNRLAEMLKNSDEGRRVWLDAATALALRLGTETGRPELAELYRSGHARGRATGEVLRALERFDVARALQLERLVLEWRLQVRQLAQSALLEDQRGREKMGAAAREMRWAADQLAEGAAIASAGAFTGEQQLAQAFAQYDLQQVQQHLRDWLAAVATLAHRYSIEVEPAAVARVATARNATQKWCSTASALVASREKAVNGSEYDFLARTLADVEAAATAWLGRLEARASGSDGLPVLVTKLQNQIEDRYAHFGAGSRAAAALTAAERASLRSTLISWGDQASHILALLATGTEAELRSVPLAAANWLTRCTDQLLCDSDTRTSENNRLQQALVGWQVTTLVRGIREPPSDAWDASLVQIARDVANYNQRLATDAACYPLEALAGPGAASLAQLSVLASDWERLARELLASEKTSAASRRALVADALGSSSTGDAS